MDQLEVAIEERREKVRRYEKEVAQANKLLDEAQNELDVLLQARQIVTRERLLSQAPSPAQLPLDQIVDSFQTVPLDMGIHNPAGISELFRYRRSTGRMPLRPQENKMTLVDEVKATLSNSPSPLGPSDIRAELAKTGRDVPQNVMTGLLSRLTKEKRVIRLERGKYRSTTDEDYVEEP